MQKSYQGPIMGMAMERYILVIYIVMEQNLTQNTVATSPGITTCVHMNMTQALTVVRTKLSSPVCLMQLSVVNNYAKYTRSQNTLHAFYLIVRVFFVYAYIENVRILYSSCNLNNRKPTVKLSKMSRNKRRSQFLMMSPKKSCLY